MSHRGRFVALQRQAVLSIRATGRPSSNSTLTAKSYRSISSAISTYFRVQERTGWFMKTPDFATGQDEAMDGIWIARPAFKPVAKMDRAKFVLVISLQPIVAHRDKGDLIGRTRENGADSRLCRDQRDCVKSFGSVSNRCDALSINKKDGVLIAVVMARLGCTRAEINRWASATDDCHATGNIMCM